MVLGYHEGMKKRFAILVACMLLLSFLVVFVVRQGHRKEAKAQPVTITYWTHQDDARASLEKELIASFLEQNPNVQINRIEHTSAEQIDLVPRAFAAGQGPDIFNMPVENECPLISKGYVAPVDYHAAGFESLSDIEDTYIDGVFDAITVKNEIYGLPLEYTNWCVYLNKEAFSGIGLDAQKDYPRTWEDVVALSLKMVKRDGTVLKRRGFDFRYPYYLNFLVPMVEQLGGKLVSDDGRIAIIGEDAWINVLTFMQQWGPGGLNLGSPTYKNARSSFSGKDASAAMALSGLYQESRMQKQYPDFYESGEWMVVPFPVFKDAVNTVAAASYAHYYMVNAKSSPETQKMAWKLIGFMLSHSEAYLSRASLVQPTKELINSSVLRNVPYSDVFINDLNRSHLIYHGPDSSRVQSLLATAVESVMLSGVSPEKAYATLKASMQEILDEQK